MIGEDLVHLRVRSEYSMLEAAGKIGPLVERAAALGLKAMALTDKGNMFGALEFYQAAEKAGIQPIIGCELVLYASKKEFGPLLLYARDEEGYVNLMRLVSTAHLEREDDPRGVGTKDLEEHATGLACLSGGPQGIIGKLLINGQSAAAEKWVQRFQHLFGPEAFFLELQDHGRDVDSQLKPRLAALSSKTGAPLVATSESLYIKAEHAGTYDILTCIRTGARIDDPKRERLLSNDYFLKNAEQMTERFADYPEALANTRRLAELCQLKITFGENRYPAYPVDPGTTREGLLKELCLKGLRERYGDRVDTEPALRERLDYELGIIEKMGFSSYFLIVWDFIDYARRHDIPVGPGRGSGAGSMVAYVLRITDLDPIHYGLIFERFLNPERVSPPDIDVDFCQDRRGDVIRYVRDKYGKRSVAQIVTYGTMGAKMAIRDVARVMGLSFTEASRIADQIPKDPKITIAKAMAASPELRTIYEEDELAHQCIDHAMNLEGIVRQTGTHAAGVVIAEGDLTRYLPLTVDDHGNVMTQYSMGMLESVGLLKADFLGLKTLTVIQEALNLLFESSGIRMRPDEIPLSDDKTVELLNQGRNIGIFQVESPGMRKLCRQFNITGLEDIIALVALYRPGPMEIIPDYIAVKKGERPMEFDHPLLEPLCRDTYGFMIYQEQVMKAAQVLAGYSLGDADLFRRAMGKKKKEVMDAQRGRFIEGCKTLNQIPADLANRIFDQLEKFAGYGFNKSHAAAYAVISFQTAYLKANHPVEFMAALMSNDLDSTDKISLFIGESREMGITVLPPSVNFSRVRFSIDEGRIRYGLAAIKGVGQGASEAIVTARQKGGPFLSMDDFCTRVEFRAINKKTVEALVRSGAFDEIAPNRAGMMEQIDKCMARASSVARDLESGQGMFFLDESPTDLAASALKEIASVPPWPKSQILEAEKQLLGVYFSGHPIDEYEEDLRAFRTINVVEIGEELDRTPIRLAGLLMGKEVRISQKSQKPFARLLIEDRTGICEVMLWAELYQEIGDQIIQGMPLIVEAVVDRSREDMVRVDLRRIIPLEDAFPGQIREVYVLAERDDCANGLFTKIKALLREHPGEHPFCLVIPGVVTGAAIIQAGDAYRVDASYPVIKKFRHVLGRGRVKLRVTDLEPTPPRRRFPPRRK